MKSTVLMSIKNYDKIKNDIDKLNKAPSIVIARTISDIHQRAPSWIADEVSKVYGINKKDVSKRGNMQIEGKRVDEMKITYTGTAMTAVHFNMSPKEPKQNEGGYTLKAKILRGKTSILGHYKKQSKFQYKGRVKNFTREGTRNSKTSPIMLQRTGTVDIGKVQYIPFQRKSFEHDKLDKIVTLSVPQMIQNEKVAPNISKVINENLGKRIEHHMKLLD